MSDQFTMSGFEEPDYKEALFLDSCFGSLQAAVEERCGDKSILAQKQTKGYTVVTLANLTVFRLHFRGKSHYITIPASVKDTIPPDTPTKQSRTEEKYIRVLIDEHHTAESYIPMLVQAVISTIERYPKDWDCCSRYLECSNAKVCVHPDKAFSLACGYRKILASGRIFYGENRNVDS